MIYINLPVMASTALELHCNFRARNSFTGLSPTFSQPYKASSVPPGWIVYAVLVENQRIGDGADLQQAMPVGIGAPGGTLPDP